MTKNYLRKLVYHKEIRDLFAGRIKEKVQTVFSQEHNLKKLGDLYDVILQESKK
jgi:hypothetical protein